MRDEKRFEWADLIQSLSRVSLGFDMMTDGDSVNSSQFWTKDASISQSLILFEDVDCLFQLTPVRMMT